MTQRTFRQLFTATALIAFALLAPPPAGAQGSPSTALQAGPNNGSADSFQGPHAWYFTAQPGRFVVTLATLGSTGDAAATGHVTVRLSYDPKSAADKFSFADNPSGVVIHGSVDRPTRITLNVVPPNSPLVRATRNYTLEATGAVAFAGATGTDPVVGTYISKRNAYGATKFLANGSILTSDGQQGHWVAFDANLHIYNVTIGADRISLKLVPGRGLVEPSNDYVVFETAH